MNVVVIKNKKQWLFKVNKGICTLLIEDEVIQLCVDHAKEILIDELYLVIFEEDTGYSIFRKYEVCDQLILSEAAYASIQFRQLNHDILINLKEKTITKNNQLFVNNELSMTYKNGDVLTVLGVRMLIMEQFILINQFHTIQVHLSLKQKLKVQNYCLPAKYTQVNEVVPNQALPVFNVVFRQFDQVHTYEKPSSFVMILPMLMMACASLVVGINACVNAYLQGKSGFDLLVPLLLPSTMILSTILVKPLHNWLELKKHKKKLHKRNAQIKVYFEELNHLFESYENNLEEVQRITLLVGSDCCIQPIKKNALLHVFDYSTIVLTLGIGELATPLHFTQEPTPADSDYFQQFLAFSEVVQSLSNKLVTVKLSEYKSLVVQDDLTFEWLLLQIIFLIDTNKTSIFLFARDEWLVGRKEYLLMELHVMFNKIPPMNLTGKSKIALVVDHESYLQSESQFDVVLFYQKSCGPCDMTISKTGSALHLNDQKILQPCVTRDQVKNLRNWLVRHAKGKQSQLGLKKLFDLVETTINQEQLMKNWQQNTAVQGLKAPVGVSGNEPFILDFNENVHGPHLLIGATTGGGKSEAIITILYSLMIRYSPAYFQFALVDFKGGGLADVFQLDDRSVPHCVGSITNLDDHEMERLLVSFDNESRRRQQLFSKMVRLTKQSPMNIRCYQQAIEQGVNLPQLAHLVYVIDEFAELKVAEPSFIQELVRLARTGRSLGIHLLLSTQKPATVVDGQIWANCNSRICLKVQDKQDSMEMIGSDRGAYLKKPGQFYLFNNQVVTEGFFALTSAPHTYKKQNKMKVLTNSLEHREQIVEGDSQIKTLLEILTKQPKTRNCLWQKSLKKMCEESFYQVKNQLGIIDDLQQNRQMPLQYQFQKNMLVYAMDQVEKQRFIMNIIEWVVHEFDNQMETLLIDIENLVQLNETTTKIVDVIRSKKAISSLVRGLSQCKTPHKHLLIVTHFPTFCDALNENYNIIEQLLFEKQNTNNIFIFITNTPNSIKYSLWHYFPIRIGLSIRDPNDYLAIFEQSIKRCCGDKGFGYIKEDDIKLFRFIPLKLAPCKKIVNTMKRIRWFDDVVISKRGQFPILGIDTETMEDVVYTEKGILFVLSKYPNSYQHYIANTFANYRQVNIDLEKNDDKVALQLIKENSADSIIVGCSQQHWKQSEVKRLFSGFNVIWVGEGFHEQTIIENERWLKLTSKEVFYVLQNKKMKLRCIDKYEE